MRLRLGTALACALGGAAHAHDGGAGTHWGGEPWLWVALALAAGLVLRGVCNLWRHARVGAGVRRWQAGAFAAGWSVLALALLSPLDALGERLFWIHMVQHELLILVAAPLLVLSRPLAAMVWGLPARMRPWAASATAALGLNAALRALSQPLAAWALHAGVLWAWHAPALFEGALRTPWLHELQHASFFASALLFWWALLPGASRQRGGAVLYVFTTALHTSVLGALLTFSGRVLYPAYEASAPAHGLSALEDQQLGGLIMWVPGGAVYLAAALGLLATWLGGAARGAAAPTR